MDSYAQLTSLLDLAEQIGLTVRAMPGTAEGSTAGALVKLRGREVLFLDSAASVADRVDLVASALAGRKELEDRFLPPELRDLLDRPGEGAS